MKPLSVVVTGSSQGLGRGLAAEFLRRGHMVVIGSRDPAADALAAQELAGLGGKVLAFTCEVTDLAQVQSLWDAATRAFGAVDIWINNAGLAKGSLPLAAQPANVMQEMLLTNIMGTTNGCQVAFAGMRAQGRGAIYNLAGAGSDGRYVPGMLGYATTKVAVQYFSRWLAREVEGTGVLVGTLSPGLVVTEGMLREHAAVPAAFRAARERYVNIIGDHVETVCAFFVDRILSNRANGAEIVWLTRRKLWGRKWTARLAPRDILSRYRKG